MSAAPGHYTVPRRRGHAGMVNMYLEFGSVVKLHNEPRSLEALVLQALHHSPVM